MWTHRHWVRLFFAGDDQQAPVERIVRIAPDAAAPGIDLERAVDGAGLQPGGLSQPRVGAAGRRATARARTCWRPGCAGWRRRSSSCPPPARGDDDVLEASATRTASAWPAASDRLLLLSTQGSAPSVAIGGYGSLPAAMPKRRSAIDRASTRIARDNGTVAVLYRTNAQPRAFESGFKQAGIPYRITGGQSFYDRPEIQDALACLQMALDPDGDDDVMRRVVDLPPHRQIGRKAIAAIDRQPGRTFWQRARHVLHAGALPEWHSRGLAQRFDLARELRDPARAAPLDDALEAVLGITGYLGALEKSADPDAGDRADNVWELIHDAGVFRKDWGDDEAETAETRLEMLAGFLEHCRSMRAPDETANADARVKLSTLHRAKGLELDTVIIAGFDAEHLPSRGTLSTADGNEEAVVEEERRLAYVGMTRARTELYLSVSQMTGRRGHERPTHPSPFLDEIPAELWTAAPEPKRIDRAAKRTKRRDPPKRGMTMGPYGPEVQLFD